MRIPGTIFALLALFAGAAMLQGCGSGDDDTPALATTTPAFEALPGATAHYGALDATVYRIEVPDDWNGELVMWAHGFRSPGEPIAAASPPAPLREAWIEGGYAWAASSYSQNGYVPGVGMDDTLSLKRFFAEEFGEPSRTYIAGESMGGGVTALSLEQHAPEYDAALTLCGAVGVVEQIDFLMSWGLVAEHLSGADLPLGDEDASNLGSLLLYSVSPALGTPAQPTPAGAAFANAMMHLTGGPRPFYREGLIAQYQLNMGLLLLDPGREDQMTRAATNENAVYTVDPGFTVGAGDLNAGVARLAADRNARDASRNPETSATTGAITVPVLSLHTTGDMFVPISQAAAYRTRVEAAGAGDLLVQRAIRAARHCDFSAAEVTTAWHDLVTWVEGGKRPDGDDLSGSLEDIGRTFTDPLRPGDPGGLR